ncbi:MAG TPA: glycosyltransferase family 2 protein [Thermosynechococcaceae cyanobacterium]
MHSNLPLVSVIIPAYNAELFIERTLRSVRTQTYRNLEVWVVDDGSTDRTPEIVSAVAQQDSRIKLLYQANAGVAAARNLGISQSRGEFVAPIDADDLWHPENLEKQVNCALAGGSTVGVVYSWSVYIDEADALLGGVRAFAIEGDVFLTLLCHNFLGNASASLIRRSCLAVVGGYDPGLRDQKAQGCEDWDLYLRLAERYEFRVVPEFLVGYRKLETSMTRDYSAMAQSYCLVLNGVKQRRPDVPDQLFQLGKSNFFMYLAFEADQTGDFRTTLAWIGQSLQAAAIVALVRPSFYRLVLRNGWAALRRRSFSRRSVSVGAPSPVSSQFIPAISNKQRFTAWIMVSIGNLFHTVVPLIAGFPKRQESKKSESKLL